MELRQLSYFVAVAEELHFGRSAMRVNIAQPATEHAGPGAGARAWCAVADRSTRKVELTRAGEVFYDRCVRMLGELDLSAEMALGLLGAGPCGDQDRHELSGNDRGSASVLAKDRPEVSRNPAACLEWLDIGDHPPAGMRQAEPWLLRPGRKHRLAALLLYCT